MDAPVKPIEDTRTPNQKRLDEMIDQNDEILDQLKLMNKNLAIVGAALIKIAEKPLSAKIAKGSKNV